MCVKKQPDNPLQLSMEAYDPPWRTLVKMIFVFWNHFIVWNNKLFYWNIYIQHLSLHQLHIEDSVQKNLVEQNLSFINLQQRQRDNHQEKYKLGQGLAGDDVIILEVDILRLYICSR